ncbi:2-hydroxyacid dehydrogenase [Acuticoccus mangrovi]|uniref:2-hydroxyacid dehydrogenase n=1 Tax=Acuticoccus mangrovi TaxID=2796142 RepID=UPI0018E93622|nr:2-hydroxyacid dehydrogenase [Acuticoccus mangrovi]
MHKILYFALADQALYDLIGSHVPEGCELVTLSSDSDEERLARLAEAEVIVLAGKHLDRRYIEAAPHLKLVNFQGVGYHDAADIETLKAHGIPFAIAPGGTAEGVSEHTIMMILATYKRLAFMDSEIRAGVWHAHDMRPKCRQLYGKVVGILGLGRIGRAVASRLQAFGVKVIYNDIAAIPPEVEAQCGAEAVSFDELVERSDVLTLHVPLTELTADIMNAETIARMKPGAILVNCARGGVVNEPALLAALQSGHLAGAGLDVRASEPPKQPDPFATLENVVMTPHVAPGTLDAMHMKMADVFENVRRLYAGEEIRDRIV